MPGLDLTQVAIGALLALIAAGAGLPGTSVVAQRSGSGILSGDHHFWSRRFALGDSCCWLSSFLPVFSHSYSRSEKRRSRRITKRDLAEMPGRCLPMVVLSVFLPSSTGFSPLWCCPGWRRAAALAAASADTWATELGILSRTDPILIVSGKRVAKGTSGGVSLAGGAASLLGASVIAAVFLFLFTSGSGSSTSSNTVWLAVGVVFSGFLGSLVDSILGATLQAIYYCPNCMKETEKHPLHHCGSETQWLRGIRWLNNDWVNFLCTLSAVVFAFLFSVII